MGNLMQLANDFVRDKRKEFLSEIVEYRRHGAARGFKVTACVGRSYFSNGNRYFAVSDVNGVTNRIRSVDFIIANRDFDGGEPEVGDLITRENGMTYEVFPPMNESCWKYSGSSNESMRIHTYDVKTLEDALDNKGEEA